jgi:hypothetical protein
VHFLHFWSSKICVSPTGVISSLSPPRCCLSSGRHHAVSCFLPLKPRRTRCICFIFRQRFIPSPPSRAKTKALNPHYHHRPPFSDNLTPTLHCYKKVISTLPTLPTTQLLLHFISSLAIGIPPYCHHSLLLLSHTRPSAQWYPWWQISRPSFTFRTTYRHVNSRKNIF